MGFVLDGEIDLRIGVTQQMADEFDGEIAQSKYAVLSIPKDTFFIIPPGVPHASGRYGHWERDSEPNLETRIFWIHFLAPGIQCHMSWNTDSGYISQGSHFVLDPHLLPAIDALTNELRLRSQSSPQIIHALLLFIGHSAERDLKKLLAAEVNSPIPEPQPDRTDPQVVEQACAYIQTRYREKISIKQVAEHTFVSPSHLSRLFKAAKGITISDYITRTRLEYACTLLLETRMGIKAIGRFVGYPSRAHFSQVFSRYHGCSPLQFRKKSDR
jgi:AraC-like DNA-binding protein